MTDLLRIERVRVPLEMALEAHAHLQRAGRQGLEGFALWAGIIEGMVARVCATYIPEQRGLRMHEGLLVVVDGEELHRLNRWLYREGLTLITQLHSHPGPAYHSETDDAFPITTAAGSLSLVVPDFARDPFALASCAVYRLSEQGAWSGLTQEEVVSLVLIEE